MHVCTCIIACVHSRHSFVIPDPACTYQQQECIKQIGARIGGRQWLLSLWHGERLGSRCFGLLRSCRGGHSEWETVITGMAEKHTSPGREGVYGRRLACCTSCGITTPHCVLLLHGGGEGLSVCGGGCWGGGQPPRREDSWRLEPFLDRVLSPRVHWSADGVRALGGASIHAPR